VGVWVDGEEVAAEVGGGTPAVVDLSGQLRDGPHELQLRIDPASAANVPGQPLSAWTFGVPRPEETLWAGRAELRIGAVGQLRTHFDADQLKATLDGASGPVTYTLVHDGEVRATWSGSPTGEVAWVGPRWPAELAWLVATDEAGHRWQARVGARSVTEGNGGPARIDGVPRYLATRRLDLVPDGDVRQSVFKQLVAAAQAGANGAEWHADALGVAAIEALDELGVPLVGVPRCAGRRQHDGIPPADTARDTWLAARDEQASALFANHPSVVGWAVEYSHLGLNPAFVSYRAMGLPFWDRDRASAVQEQEWPRTRPRPWVVELP
jgi:hypothetical protein